MNRRLVLALMLAMTLLAGCGGGAATIDTWASHLEAGDYDKAKAMMINPSYDWQESTQRQLQKYTWKNHKIFDIAAAGQTAMTKGSQRVQWELISLSGENASLCTDVLVKDGEISADRATLCEITASSGSKP